MSLILADISTGSKQIVCFFIILTTSCWKIYQSRLISEASLHISRKAKHREDVPTAGSFFDSPPNYVSNSLNQILVYMYIVYIPVVHIRKYQVGR